jgi:hypothetical protein
MSVISSLPVTPNRIEIVYRYLRYCGDNGVAKDDLMQTLSPPALKSGSGRSSIAQDVVREASRIGIIVLDSDGCYRLSPELRDTHDLDLLEWLESILLDPVRAKKAGQPDFPYALAWLLEQNPAEPFEFGDNIAGLIASQCGTDVNAFGMTNRARSQNFVYWAQYLGYAWRLKVGSIEAIMPDPTQAIERHLSQLLKEPGESLIEDLLYTWATQSPVLEGGAARIKIVELCRGDSHRDPKLLSRSTSIALLRLEERGVIRLERRADAEAYTLNIKPNPRPVSHVAWHGGK